MKTGKIDDWALHAYVDNEVSSEQRAEIEELLHANPEMAQRVEDWRHQRSVLKQAYDNVLDEAPPRSLTATLRSGGVIAAKPYLAMAAALALLLLGGFGGWFLSLETGRSHVADFADRALNAHAVYAVEVRHPVEVRADEKEHLQSWLSKRVGTAFHVPDLTAEGYKLLGGRLLAADDGPAALLMYEDAKSNRITILLSAAAEDTGQALHVEQRGNLTACYWRDGGLAFAVAGEMPREPMMKLAEAVYKAFES